MIQLAVALPQKDINDYWDELNLSIELLEDEVNNRTCHLSHRHMIACVKSINAIYAYLDEPLEIMTTKRFNAMEEKPTFIKDFNSVKLVMIRMIDADTFREYFVQRKEEKARSNQSFYDLFEQEFRPINFEAILAWTKRFYIKEDNESAVTANAYNEYLTSLHDPHTGLMPKAYFKNEFLNPPEAYFGVGAALKPYHDRIVIDRPMENSPALRAGLRARDVITHVDGEDVRGQSLNTVAEKIRGPEGTDVTLTIERDGAPLTLRITRGKVLTKNVSSKLLTDGDQRVGYVKLRQFTSSTSCQDVTHAIQALGKTAGLILDLRNNTGGQLEQSICIASIFLHPGLTVATRRSIIGSRVLHVEKSVGGYKYRGLLILIINASSASASEIVSGALQDHLRAVIVGERSFGKASIQALTKWTGHPDVIFKKTVSRFYLPSGRTNQIYGITPDLTVHRHPDPTEEDTFAIREADSYTNALPALGRRWKQQRPRLISHLKSCADQRGLAKRLAKERASDAIPPDYQLFYAQDVMSCM